MEEENQIETNSMKKFKELVSLIFDSMTDLERDWAVEYLRSSNEKRWK